MSNIRFAILAFSAFGPALDARRRPIFANFHTFAERCYEIIIIIDVNDSE